MLCPAENGAGTGIRGSSARAGGSLTRACSPSHVSPSGQEAVIGRKNEWPTELQALVSLVDSQFHLQVLDSGNP